MANFGRRPITDAGKPKPYVTYYHDGEERLDRRPLGTVSRFIDPQGNVVSLQLAGDGDPQKAMTIERRKLELRRDGFVEHAKCPLRHGTHLTAGTIAKDFQRLIKDRSKYGIKWDDTACESDPKVMSRKDGDLHAHTGCVHVEALIEYRVKYEQEQAAKRNATRIAQEKREKEKQELETLQLDMVREQVRERKSKKVTTGAPKE